MIKNVIFFKFYILKDESYFFLKLFLLKMLFEQRFVMILQITINCIIFEGCFCQRFIIFFFFLIMLYLFFLFFFIHIYVFVFYSSVRKKHSTSDRLPTRHSGRNMKECVVLYIEKPSKCKNNNVYIIIIIP